MQTRRKFLGVALLGVAAVGLAACGSDSKSGAGATTTSGEKVTQRLGYFPNVTHATALNGIGKGIFAE